MLSVSLELEPKRVHEENATLARVIDGCEVRVKKLEKDIDVKTGKGMTLLQELKRSKQEVELLQYENNRLDR